MSFETACHEMPFENSVLLYSLGLNEIHSAAGLGALGQTLTFIVGRVRRGLQRQVKACQYRCAVGRGAVME